jgi:hypothetical protein
LTGYLLGAKELGFEADGVIYDYLLKLKEPKFERPKAYRTPEQIQDFIEDTPDTVRGIQMGLKYRNISKDCGYCRFQKYCSRDPQAKELYYQEK